MDHLAWRELSRKTVYEGRIFRVAESEQGAADGRTGRFTLVECADWVNVVALGSDARGEPALLMVRQYRFGGARLGLEFPGGVMDPGEDPESAARRELLEETGYIAKEWLKLGEANPNPAFMTNRLHTMLARDLVRVGPQSLDENEIIDCEMVPLARIAAGGLPEFEANALMLVNWYWFRRWQDNQGAAAADKRG